MIRRFLLLLCLFFSSQVFAQQENKSKFQLIVDWAIMGENNRSGCNSLYEISAVYTNKESEIISSGTVDGLNPGDVYHENRWLPKTIVVTDQYPLRRVASFGKRNLDNCSNQAWGERGYDVPNTYCTDTHIFGQFAGFHPESMLHVTTRPLSNVWNLEIKTTEIYTNGQFMNYTVNAYYSDNSRDEVFTFFWTAGTPAQTINRTFNAVHGQGRRIVRLHISSYSNGTQREEDINIPQNNGNEYYGSVSNIFARINTGSNISISYKKESNRLDYGPIQGSNILPTNSEITVTGPSNIPASEYRWRYQAEGEGDTWHDAPGFLQATNPLRISAASLFQGNINNYLNKNINIKMYPACNPDRESGIITLDCRLSAPRIVSITPKKISCTGANDGGFSIRFDRPLYPNETVNLETKDLLIGTGGTMHNDISANVSADGSYTWPYDGLRASDYQITVTGLYNGRATAIEGVTPSTFSLGEPTPVNWSVTSISDVKCFAGSDGIITLNASGGAGGYVALYKAVNDNTYINKPFNTINGLIKGEYLVQVKDQNGCAGKLASGDTEKTVTVNQPDAPLTLDASDIVHPKAFGYADGIITAHMKGGTIPYTFVWKKADGTVLPSTDTDDGNGIFTTVLKDHPDGDYTVTVTDANSCTYIDTFTLKQPPALVANIQITDSVSCTGTSDGTLTAVITGGVPFKNPPLYAYAWYEVVNGIPVAIGQTDITAVNLHAGKYMVIAKDANNISIASGITNLIDPAPLKVRYNTTPATCYDGNNGALEALVSGGTSPYRYKWDNGTEAAYNPGLHAGGHTVEILDYHDCSLTSDSTVYQPAGPIEVIQPILTQPLAFGYSDGSISIQIQGGTPAYTVQWKKADGTPVGGNSTTLSNIPAGDYIVTITDAQYTGPDPNMEGCTLTVPFTLNQPPPLEVTISQQHFVSCKGHADGVLTTTTKGGVPFTVGEPYLFEWFRYENGAYKAIPGNTDLIAGTYQVIITDSNNIHKTSLPFVLVEPDVLQVQLISAAVSCFSGQDGAIIATVTGGTTPYNYEWSNGETGRSIINLTEGDYLVFVKDIRGCETQNHADVSIPDGIRIESAITPPICAGSCDGAINTLISGGIPPYSITWSNGAATNNISQLCADKYTLTIEDANKCKRVQAYNLPNPAPLKVDLGGDISLCNGQRYTVRANIADPVATYVWAGPDFNANTAEVDLQNSGDYHVTVTDGKGCVMRDTINITQVLTDISAEFVASTQVFQNEEVSLINISAPVPERTVWEIPEGRNITVLQNTPLLAGLRFADTGVYRIRLHSFTGDCERVFTKEIAVLESAAMPIPGGANTPFINTFEVLPNPSNGQFTVQVTLDKAADIRLRMFNIISNQLVNDRRESAASQFRIPYQLNITAGTYVLLLETPLGTAIRKIIITQ